MEKLKDVKSLNEKPQASTPKVSNNGPNKQIMIIEEIAGLLSQANEKMYKLPIHPIRSKAIEEIDLLQKVTIVELKKVFE